MKDQDSNDSIRMSRRDLLWMGTAGLVGGSLLARTPTALGQASAQLGPNNEAAYVPRPRAPQYRFRVGATTLNLDGRGLDAAHRGAEHASQRADVDSLARPVAARRYGWRPGRLRFSHRAQAGLRLRVSTAPERHVLVSFALAIAGTDRDGRPVRDRSQG